MIRPPHPAILLASAHCCDGGDGKASGVGVVRGSSLFIRMPVTLPRSGERTGNGESRGYTRTADLVRIMEDTFASFIFLSRSLALSLGTLLRSLIDSTSPPTFEGRLETSVSNGIIPFILLFATNPY